MKRAFSQFINLMMVVIVLITSTGFGFIERSCMMRGKQVSLVMSPKSLQGCSTQNKCVPFHQEGRSSLRRAACCKIDQHYANVDFTSSLTQLLAKFIKSASDLALIGIAALFNWLPSLLSMADTSLATYPAASPPLLFGRSLLSFVQRFLL